MFTASEYPYVDFNKVNLDWIADTLKNDKKQIEQNTADIEELKAGGTVIDYEDLQNLPEINSVTLIGNKSLDDIGAASADELSDLKSAVNKLVDADGLTMFFRSHVDRKLWYNGGFINYASRLSTTVPVQFPYDVTINCPWYAITIYKWSSNVASTETLIESNIYTDTVTVDANTYFTITFSKTNNVDFDINTDPDLIVADSPYSILDSKVDMIIDSSPIKNGLILGDFYNGNIINSQKRMINSKPETMKVPKVITTDFANYRIYIHEKADSTWTGLGWKTSDYPLTVGYSYMFVIAINGTEPTSLTSEQQADMKAKTFYKPLDDYLKTSYGDAIAQNTSQINANTVLFEVYPTYIPSFSGNRATNDPLVMRGAQSFYTRALTGGQAFTYHTCNALYTISNGQCLVFNRNTQGLEVVSASALIQTKYVVLLWKHGVTIKGLWEDYYTRSIIPSYARKYYRLMNRQGEGYGYPDNSIPGVLMAIYDGYKMVRIAVAHTSDNVFYVTHSYEMQHNSQYGYLKQNDVAYTSDVNINSVTSEFIDSLTYKDYPIPKLSDMLNDLSLYDIQITVELKDSNDATTAQILLDQLNYNNLNYVISGTSNQLSPFVALRNDLDIAVIFEYSDADANAFIQQYEGHCKSLRFDCYWSDTISATSIKNVIHPKYKIKLGGGTGVPADTEIAPYLAWADVAEVNYVYSRLP